MKKNKVSEEKIIEILRASDATSVADAAKKYGVSTASIYGWRRKYQGMNVEEVKRLKALTSENARLKKLLAEERLANDILKEINSKKW
jgi:putative transposase